jgi:hypothetical protein
LIDVSGEKGSKVAEEAPGKSSRYTFREKSVAADTGHLVELRMISDIVIICEIGTTFAR